MPADISILSQYGSALCGFSSQSQTHGLFCVLTFLWPLSTLCLTHAQDASLYALRQINIIRFQVPQSPQLPQHVSIPAVIYR